MNKTGIPYLEYGWNPCGFGCSKGCPTCWAASMAKRFSGNKNFCPDCAKFEVHFHPERLSEPAKLKKPAVIGVQFTGDLFDPLRMFGEVEDVMRAAHIAPQHQYVFLTQRPDVLAMSLHFMDRTIGQVAPPENWFFGVTVRNQAQLGALEEELTRCEPIHHLWLSVEPMQDPMGIVRFLQSVEVCGVVIGADNRPSVPFDVAWAVDLVAQIREESPATKIYVKQLRINGKLEHDVAEFPESLRLRELPWNPIPEPGQMVGKDEQ